MNMVSAEAASGNDRLGRDAGSLGGVREAGGYAESSGFVPPNSGKSALSLAKTFSDLAIVSLLDRICDSNSAISLRVCSIVRFAASTCSRSGP